jgi:hypothetical protein
MLASAVPRLMGTNVTSSSSSSKSLLSSRPGVLSPAAAAAEDLRVLRGVTVAAEPPGVPRGVAGVMRESAGCSWNTKPVALHSTTQQSAGGGTYAAVQGRGGTDAAGQMQQGGHSSTGVRQVVGITQGHALQR